MKPVISRIHTVRLSDTGLLGTLKPASLLNILQDIAAEHAMELGFGVKELAERGMAWFVCRLSVKVDRYPVWGEKVTIRSWPSGDNGLMSLRDFEIADEAGKTLAAASSAWLVIKIKKRRPLRPARALGDIPVNPERALKTDFDEIEEVEGYKCQEVFKPRFAETDINGHINNTVYLAWAIESLPHEILHSSQPTEIEIMFKSEVALGQEVIVRTSIADDEINKNTAVHSIQNSENGIEAARVKTVWKDCTSFRKKKS